MKPDIVITCVPAGVARELAGIGNGGFAAVRYHAARFPARFVCLRPYDKLRHHIPFNAVIQSRKPIAIQGRNRNDRPVWNNCDNLGFLFRFFPHV